MPETAEMLGVSYETARKRLSRALERLRKRIARRGMNADETLLASAIATSFLAAPSSAVSDAESVVVVGGENGNAFSLASDLIHSMQLLALKKAVAAVAILAFSIAGLGIVLAQDAPAKVPPLATTRPATAPSLDLGEAEFASNVRRAVLARLETLKNLSVEYEMKSFYLASTLKPTSVPTLSSMNKAGVQSAFVPRTESSNSTTLNYFSYLNGSAIWNSKQTTINDPADVPPEDRLVVDAESRSQLMVYRDGKALGTIQTPSNLAPNPNTLVERALGMRTEFQLQGWVDSDTVLKADVILNDNGGVQLRSNIENSPYIHQWTLSKELGYSPVEYRYFNPLRPESFIEIKNGDFNSIAGVMVPMSIVRRRVAPIEGKPTERDRFEVSVKEYKIQDPQNTRERYVMQWPAGARVTDHRSNMTFLVSDGPKPLDDAAETAIQDLGAKVLDDHQTAGDGGQIVEKELNGGSTAPSVILPVAYTVPRRYFWLAIVASILVTFGIFYRRYRNGRFCVIK